ncbi:MAG: hypothetical protein CMJ83_16355 [Planctomycetes bacterium]|nr:hypothetical protein [Planctomycetota bacterium]
MLRTFAVSGLLAVAIAATATAQSASKVDPWTLKATENGKVAEFLVLLTSQADLTPARRLKTRDAKGHFVYRTLFDHAEATQGDLRQWLAQRAVPHRSYYIVNLFWVRADRAVVDALAARPDVGSIEGNPVVRGIQDHDLAPVMAAGPLTIEPGIAFTNADQVWALGFTGQGVVIGGQDTGYEWDHAAIQSRYRGWNGSTASHDFNWHDAIHSGGGSCGSDSPIPCDDHNHGTHTMGTAVGDDGAGNQVGMAPGAQFICARNMDQGNGTPATYLECFEFFLAPYPVSGTPAQGNPSLGPDLTTNSWLCPPSEGCNLTSLLLACQAQRAAGIVTCVAAGNSGSSCSTVQWVPATYDEVYSVGAHRHTNGNLSSFSSRGPVTVDGSNRMKPDVSAPGQSIRSCIRNGGYQTWNGTSMATPHVAGAVALLFSAHPDLKGQVDLTEQILNEVADHVSSNSCSSSGFPNNLWGWGRLDAYAAVMAVRTMTVSATTPQTGAPGTTATYAVTVDNTGYVTDTYTVSLSSSAFSTSASTQVTVNAGQSQVVNVSVQIPALAPVGVQDSVQVNVASMSWGPAAAATTLTTTVGALVPTLTVSQPGGAGTGVVVANGNLLSGREYYNVFSFEACPGAVGSGPYFGLCASNPQSLVSQFLLPLGYAPFHWEATGATGSFGPFPLPTGFVVQGVCFDWTGNSLGGISTVADLTVN